MIAERGKLAAHVRENLKTLGLERRIKAVGVIDLLREQEASK